MKRVALGASFALMALITIGSVASASKNGAAVNGQRYTLQVEVDGQQRVADRNLSRADCADALFLVDQWTQGHADYSCVAEVRK